MDISADIKQQWIILIVKSKPECWEEANGEGKIYPIFDAASLFFRFFANQTAKTTRLIAKRPTTPTATAVPPFMPLSFLDDSPAVIFVLGVADLAVGFSVAIAGNGGGEVGVLSRVALL